MSETSYKQNHSATYFAKSLLAGGVSGSVAKTITAPLDRVKILFQGYNPVYIRHSGTPFGVFKAILQIYEHTGIVGLFQGHSAMLLRIFPSAAIRFMSYEQYRMMLIPDKEHNTPWRHFLAGSMAGNTAVLVTYPLEIVRTRLAFQIRHQIPVETHRKHHTFHPPVPHKHIEHSGYTIAKDNYGIIHTCRTVYQEGGILAFYKGFLTTMLGIVPYAGAAFMSYEYMKQKCFSEYKESTTVWNEKRQKHELKIGTHLLIGGAAGMFGQTAAYPFDTVRHRLQLVGISKSIPTYKSMVDAFKTIFRVEGWRGFFVGLSINYWKTMPANAVAFVTYEKMKQLLEI